MDKEQDNKNRGKLTLRLKTPSASDPKTLALKNAENKRISNSLVQVTIKGRKKEPAQVNPIEPKGLSSNEFEARKNALGNLSNKSDLLENNDYQLSAKIGKKSLAKKEEVEEEVVENNIEIPEVEAEPLVTEAPAVVDIVEEPEETSFEVDNFDVHNKIKKSLAFDNHKKEEREKLLEERRKAEKEKQEKEKEKRNKFKKGGKSDDFEDEFEKSSAKKSKIIDPKSTKVNRRLLQTFIIDDGGEAFSRHRKKQKVKLQEEAKEHTKITREIILPSLITVSELSDRMAEKAGDVVKKLFSMGVVATSNQVIDADTAELVVSEFGHTVKRVLESDVENVLNFEEDKNVLQLERAPVVTIMGHVDHGKTSLLDAIKSTDVVSGESGGITQHIGASRIQTNTGKYITFLDTPGHEAFTEMRSRGANITDIVVLVVAADDGVKAQTVEAINHAKAAGVPIIVAVNKIDKPGADSSRVKNELLNYEIIAEDLSGDTMFIEVSAKQKTNLDKLEEAILLQAEVLELKAPYQTRAQGVVIEARVDPSKGVVATLLVQKGTLNISDIVVAGTSYGRVKKMTDDHGKNIKIATPSMPVEILGLDFAPNAGDQFSVIMEEKHARDIIAYRSKKERDDKNLKNSAKSVSDIFKEAGKGRIRYLPLIVKGDVHGSVEAICGSLIKLNNEEVGIKIIHSATGGITETDVSLAAVAGAIIIGFNVRANNAAKELARQKKIDIRYHSIIYNIVDETKLLLGGMLDPIKNEEFLGQAEIRQVFKVSGSGKIAGCFVTSGIIKRGAKVRLLRDNVVIYDGGLKTLKRFKDDVKEVKNGFECGAALENFDDMKEGDVIECYEIVEKKRTL